MCPTKCPLVESSTPNQKFQLLGLGNLTFLGHGQNIQEEV